MPQAQDSILRLIISNMWHNWPSYRGVCERAKEIVSLARKHGADVLLLQEVARTPNCTVAEFIAKELGMYHVVSYFSGALADERKPAEGVAVVSRFPIMAAKPYRGGWAFPVMPYFTLDTGLAARLKFSWGSIWVVSVHMGFRSLVNPKAIEELAEWVDWLGRRESVLLGGDFNMPASGRASRYASRRWRDLYRDREDRTKEHPVTYRIRYPIPLPVQSRLDYLFLRPGRPDWKVRDAKVLKVEEGGFDHYPVWYELELAEQLEGEETGIGG